jgi:hypothetical protein
MTSLSGICQKIKSFANQLDRNFLLENQLLAQAVKNFSVSCKTDLYFRVHNSRQPTANLS